MLRPVPTDRGQSRRGGGVAQPIAAAKAKIAQLSAGEAGHERGRGKSAEGLHGNLHGQAGLTEARRGGNRQRRKDPNRKEEEPDGKDARQDDDADKAATDKDDAHGETALIP